jgi:hypothetical protein
VAFERARKVIDALARLDHERKMMRYPDCRVKHPSRLPE